MLYMKANDALVGLFSNGSLYNYFIILLRWRTWSLEKCEIPPGTHVAPFHAPKLGEIQHSTIAVTDVATRFLHNEHLHIYIQLNLFVKSTGQVSYY